MSRQSAEPVIRVDRVRDTRALEESGHAVGELRDVVGEFLAVERGGGTGRDEVDAKSRFDGHDLADTSVVSTGVDVDVVAESSEGAREFADVHVHSPAI